MEKLEYSLNQIFEKLKNENLISSYSKYLNFNNIIVDNITYNSKEVDNNSLFICKGINFKEDYLKEALKNGACGYISEKLYNVDSNIPYIQVNDIRKSLAILAAYYYNYTYKNFKLIGITGTKGKTTTTNYLKNILDDSEGKKTAYISTMHIYTGTTDKDNHLTTPESLDLHKYFYETYQNHMKYLTMEVSSQSYKVDRVYGIHFNVGVFLNISEDHISPIEHPSFEDYLQCKLQLLKNCDIAVINHDSEYFDSMAEASKDAKKVVTFSINANSNADFYVTSIDNTVYGYNFVVESKKYNLNKTFRTQIKGRFNIENALAAISIAKVLNIDNKFIYSGIQKTQVAGRMSVYTKQNITVIVDYAHNKLSFEKLFETIKLDYPEQNISIVFGCPGNKAYNRRKDLGTISAKNANMIYLTEDDPQKESVKDICMDISTYIEKEKGKYTIIEDRKQAIKEAINNAAIQEKKQIVIIAGKGSETTQKVNSQLEKYEGDIYWVQKFLEDIR